MNVRSAMFPILFLLFLPATVGAEQIRSASPSATPGATPVAAATATPAPVAAPSAAAKPKGTRRSRAVSAPAGTMENGILKFDPMTIEGRIEKPIPIHARERTTPVFQDLLPEESFLGEILDASEEEPF